MDRARYHKLQIGNHALRPETLMLGYGYDPALSEGAAKPPVFLTSTFVFRSAEDGRDFFDYVAGRRDPPTEGQSGLVYSRFNHPNLEIVEDRLAVYERLSDAWGIGFARFVLGSAALGQRDYALARPLLEDAHALLSAQGPSCSLPAWPRSRPRSSLSCGPARPSCTAGRSMAAPRC